MCKLINIVIVKKTKISTYLTIYIYQYNNCHTFILFYKIISEGILQNRWNNCLLRIRSINFFVSHIYRERNQCVDSLTTFGLTVSHLTIWLDIPDCIKKVMEKTN